MRVLYKNAAIKIALAAVSGHCVYWWFGFSADWFDAIEDTVLSQALIEILFYGISGALFAAGVLIPNLNRDRFIWFKTLGLVIISAISFWSAIRVVSEFVGTWESWGPGPERCAVVQRRVRDFGDTINMTTIGKGHNPNPLDEVNEYFGKRIFNDVDKWIQRRLAVDGACTNDPE